MVLQTLLVGTFHALLVAPPLLSQSAARALYVASRCCHDPLPPLQARSVVLMNAETGGAIPRLVGVNGTLTLVDVEGDELRFRRSGSTLKLFVGDELFSEDVTSLTFSRATGKVHMEGEDDEGDDVEGDFQLQPEELIAQAARLNLLAAEANVPWLGDLPVDLPEEVEFLFMKDEELLASRPGARILWLELLKVYPSQESAIAAVKRNSAIIMPYLNRPPYISGCWDVLNGMMSEEEALDVVTRNPGILACNPVGLRTSNAAVIKGTAGAVDAFESLLKRG